MCFDCPLLIQDDDDDDDTEDDDDEEEEEVSVTFQLPFVCSAAYAACN